MTSSDIMRIGREALVMTLILGGPVLVVSLLVGTVIALLQAVTQVHEQTLTFLPKLIAVAIVLAASGGWMLEVAVSYTTRTFNHIPALSE